MTPLTERRAVLAIRVITKETGYPPTPEELAYALGVTTRQVHSALLWAKRNGAVRYDSEGRLVESVVLGGIAAEERGE